jgi:hypothetical protein
LLARSIYIIGVCPRTARGDVLDNEFEGEHWTNFCRFDRFVTRSKEEENAPSRPRPEITSTETHPATLGRNNHIVIRFRAARRYEWFFVQFSRPGQAEAQAVVALLLHDVNRTAEIIELAVQLAWRNLRRGAVPPTKTKFYLRKTFYRLAHGIAGREG